MKILINFIKTNKGFSLYFVGLLLAYSLAIGHNQISDLLNNDKQVLSETVEPVSFFTTPDTSSFRISGLESDSNDLIELAESTIEKRVNPKSTLRLESKTYPNLAKLSTSQETGQNASVTCTTSEKSFVELEFLKLETQYVNSTNLKADALEVCIEQMNQLKQLHIDECDRSLIRCNMATNGCNAPYTQCIDSTSLLYDSSICKSDFDSEENLYSEVVATFEKDLEFLEYLRDHCK